MDISSASGVPSQVMQSPSSAVPVLERVVVPPVRDDRSTKPRSAPRGRGGKKDAAKDLCSQLIDLTFDDSDGGDKENGGGGGELWQGGIENSQALGNQVSETDKAALLNVPKRRPRQPANSWVKQREVRTIFAIPAVLTRLKTSSYVCNALKSSDFDKDVKLVIS